MPSFTPRGPWFALGALACIACTTGGCASYCPPFTQLTQLTQLTQPGTGTDDATLVFLWPVTSCDPAGHFTLATTDGRFLGNLARGTQLRTTVPAGVLTVVGWNEAMEAVTGRVQPGTVPVLKASVAAGRTYYVRVLLGEWDDEGPPPPGLRPGSIVVNRTYYYSGRRCIETTDGMTSAMATVAPSSASWAELPGWTASLDVLEPDRAGGQAWLDAHRAVLEAHRAVGEQRIGALRPDARRMATVALDDGVSDSVSVTAPR